MLLYSKTEGKGKPIVLLHGMASSSRYFKKLLPKLTKRNKVVAVDLLGFGRSPKPRRSSYTIVEHLQAINDTLDAQEIAKPFTLVGHSMGALLVVKYAIAYPERVSRVVLLNPPLYANPEEAKREITKSKRHLRILYFGNSSRLICNLWCKSLRPLSRRLAPLYLKHLPEDVARDSVLHTWRSYSRSLQHLVLEQAMKQDLKRIKTPTLIVMGKNESKTVLKNLSSLEKIQKRVETLLLEGDHHLVLQYPKIIAELILSDKN